MPTAVWTGNISFGLVTVPVKLTPATKSRDVSFNQLEAGTGSRVRNRRVSEQTGEEITSDKIVKGYEIEKGPSGGERRKTAVARAGAKTAATATPKTPPAKKRA